MMKRVFLLLLSLICVMNSAFCSVPDCQLTGSLVENKSIKKVGKYLVQYVIKSIRDVEIEVINFDYFYQKEDLPKVIDVAPDSVVVQYWNYAVSDSVVNQIYDHIKKRDPHILKKFKPYADNIKVAVEVNSRGELCRLFFYFRCGCDKKIRPINIVRLTKSFDGLKLRSPKDDFKYIAPSVIIAYKLRFIINTKIQ